MQLYGYQQHLKQLQASLAGTEEARGRAQAANAELAEELQRLREEVRSVWMARRSPMISRRSVVWLCCSAEAVYPPPACQVTAEEAAAGRQAAVVEARQAEQERLRAALRAAAAGTEASASDIAVAKRVTYATDEAVQQAEGRKEGQDLLVDLLQARVERLDAAAAASAEAAAASQADTAEARQLLGEAARELEAVQAETQGLVARWQEELGGARRREEVLEVRARKKSLLGLLALWETFLFIKASDACLGD